MNRQMLRPKRFPPVGLLLALAATAWSTPASAKYIPAYTFIVRLNLQNIPPTADRVHVHCGLTRKQISGAVPGVSNGHTVIRFPQKSGVKSYVGSVTVRTRADEIVLDQLRFYHCGITLGQPGEQQTWHPQFATSPKWARVKPGTRFVVRLCGRLPTRARTRQIVKPAHPC